MLTAKIMHECIKKLITLRNEESLESLCKLLNIVGKGLEQETEVVQQVLKSRLKLLVPHVAILVY